VVVGGAAQGDDVFGRAFSGQYDAFSEDQMFDVAELAKAASKKVNTEATI